LGGTFSYNDPKQAAAAAVTTPRTPMTQQSSYFPPAQTAIDMYAQSAGQQPMAALLAASSASYGNINTPISPFNVSGAQPGHITTPNIPQQPQNQQTPTHHQHIPFDPSDPAIFNFNIDGLNFGNKYGALEFNMLQTMSNGMNDSHGDVLTPLNSHVPSAYSLNFSSPVAMFDQMSGMNYNVQGPGHRHPPSNPDLKTPNNTPLMKSADVPESSGNNIPYAYAIGAAQRPNSLASASPVSLSQENPASNEGNNSPALFAAGVGVDSIGFAVDGDHQLPGPLHPHRLHHQHHHQPVQHPHSAVTADTIPSIAGRTVHHHSHPFAPLHPRKRQHNADAVYGKVQKPYSYHAGWHRLFSYIKDHFSKENVQRIAQYVSVIRPPLTAFAQSLSVNDLIFMETTVQRQLFEYREFIKATGTPTIVTRRDGTILAVSEEFCKMTRWDEAVVLGKVKNWNVNRGQGSLQAIREREKAGLLEIEDEDTAWRGGDGQGVLISEIFDQQ
jgi:PAS domain-containing protein